MVILSLSGHKRILWYCVPHKESWGHRNIESDDMIRCCRYLVWLIGIFVIRSGSSLGRKMKINLILILIGAVLASFVNLVWETLDYGFPDDLVAPSSDQEQLVILCHMVIITLPRYWQSEGVALFIIIILQNLLPALSSLLIKPNWMESKIKIIEFQRWFRLWMV